MGDFMILFNRKRILFILTAIIISIASINSNQTIQTSSIPSSSHTVIIDAGHGIPDGGAIGNDGTNEESINLAISLKLQNMLESTGTNVVLTRSDENGIYDLNSKNKKKSDLINRTKIGNSSNSEIFISIHLNKIDLENCSGWQTFYQKNNENSKKLANLIQENLNQCINKSNKREILPLSGKYIMDNVTIPTVTVECGFLSNTEELQNLKKAEYQENLAWGIYEGIIDYFSDTMI